jgi:hypothetical protein
VTLSFSLSRGGTARLVETNGDFVTVLSSVSAPPGTPLEGELEGAGYRIKVRACRRTEEDPELPFRIEGRFQNLSRAQRERVTRAD